MAAPATSRPKLAALDTNVLFHLAENHAPAHNVVLRLIGGGFTPVVTQTVVQELGFAALEAPTAHKRQMATLALENLRRWHIQPCSLVPVGNGICDVIANVLFAKNLLPPEEVNDACIFIECAFWAVAMLVTWDNHLLDAPNAALNEVMNSFDLNPVQIVHPKVILGY